MPVCLEGRPESARVFERSRTRSEPKVTNQSVCTRPGSFTKYTVAPHEMRTRRRRDDCTKMTVAVMVVVALSRGRGPRRRHRPRQLE